MSGGRALPAWALMTGLVGGLLAGGGCQGPLPSSETMELAEGWELRVAGSAEDTRIPIDLADTLSRWLPAQVPGTVHTDLLSHGLIPDPFWRDVEPALQWIDKQDWVYRLVFQVSQRVLEKEVAELVFHGLDTYAEVTLNGQAILEADNMFRRWTVDVSGRLQPGENTLEVLFHSPLQPALAALEALPYELPAGNDRGDPPSRVFTRKAAYHYGWDWGPRFVTSGIWRPVQLRAWSGARIADLQVYTDSLADGRAHLRAAVTVETSLEEAERRAAGGGIEAVLEVSSPTGEFETVSAPLSLARGETRLILPITVAEPRLWWPNGSGDQNLYSVRAALHAGRRVDTLTTRTGIREVELVTRPDSVGESFFFQVNGRPVFMKGANVIPLDHFSPRVDEEDYRALFRDVVNANMNMLRVWGGGIYETDLFYDLADEKGILIWQDFMFANGMYPGDSLFLANVREEATQQVKRLRNHPSLALWCGNNEMDEGWNNWGWARRYDSPADSAAVRDAYLILFQEVLPSVVQAEDPGRRYWPSSPSLGWGNPESLTRGDSHYWGVWHGQEPFQVFEEKLPRFSSEFGFQAFPPMATVEAFTAPEDRSIHDPTLLVHQKHPIGNEIITEYMGRDYPVPAGFQDFVYVSQLLQARGMQRAFEAHRRARPRTMGTLYWQLNDTWPAISWSSRDYFGRWKALHYAAREAFAPILVSPTLEGDTLSAWMVSDLAEPVTGTLYLELLDFQGTSLWQAPVQAQLPPGTSRRLWTGLAANILGGVDPGRVVFVAEWVQDDAPSPGPSGHLYFRAPRELRLETPAIRLDLALEEGRTRLTLESTVLAKDVYLTLDGTNLPENFFDLLPNRPFTLYLDTDLTLEELKTALTIKTLADVPREGVEVPEEAGHSPLPR